MHTGLPLRELVWDMKRAGEVVRRCAAHIQERHRWALVESFLERFETQAIPLFPGLRESIIHNDGNDYNLLVTTPPRRPGPHSIAGIIDFGDMLQSITAANPAIAAAYALLDKPDPLAAVAQVIGGYHEIFPLTERELEVMFPLVCMRLATSVALSAYQQRQEPENRYLSVSEKPAWDALERLAAIHPRLAHYALRAACGFEPCPRTPAIVAWLKQNRSDFGSVVDCNPAVDPVVIFDLSVETPFESELFLPAAPPQSGPKPEESRAHAQAVTELLFGVIKAAGARAGVGRYNEARLLYTTDQYQVPSNSLPETRTVHIGIDLFLPPGSPVFAPMDGTIHSFRDNAQLLDYGPTIILKHETDGADDGFFTLYGHLSRPSLEGLVPGMPVRKGERIAWIGADPEMAVGRLTFTSKSSRTCSGARGNFPASPRPACARCGSACARIRTGSSEFLTASSRRASSASRKSARGGRVASGRASASLTANRCTSCAAICSTCMMPKGIATWMRSTTCRMSGTAIPGWLGPRGARWAS